MKLSRSAQSIVEYVVVVAAIVGGLTIMQLYVRRALQGRLKDLANEIGPQGYHAEGESTNYIFEQRTSKTQEVTSSDGYKKFQGYADASGTPDVGTEPEVTFRWSFESSER